ncbi:MAG: tetratricopeptide repeat protein [Candidatus Eisenbacteria bacterium]
MTHTPERPRGPRGRAAKRSPRDQPGAAPPPPPAESLPLTHPAFLAAIAWVAATILWSVSFHLPDTDSWQHLLVGKAIWQLRQVPTTQLWTWPTYGAPDVNPSWGFRALVWPFWQVGEVCGLFAWRWATTLGAFTLLWLAARRMGARGMGPLAALAACAVLYRMRVQIRPETLAAVLLAFQIWILETRRHGGPNRSLALLPIALVWANCHISYFLFFVVLGAHALDDLMRDSDAPAGGRFRLLAIGAASLVVMLINPWGWQTLWQPFAYQLEWRREAIFATIGELGRPRWAEELWNGALVLGLAVPALFLWRWRRTKGGPAPDRVQLVMLLVFCAMAVSSMRFLGFFALALAPYLARDLDAWLATRRWPRWTAAPWARSAGVAAVSLGIALPSWTLPGAQMGPGMDWSESPVAACDFIARHDVHGRNFNSFELGGYLLWRFWPEKDRLPFMDIHVAGTRDDRRAYLEAHRDPDAWRALEAKHRFDWILLRHRELPGDRLLDTLDEDSTWALVFVDDVAALYTRRDGPLEAGSRFEYQTVPAGHAGLGALGAACGSDTALRRRARAEFERMAAASGATAGAHTYLSLLAEMDGRWADAERHQKTALERDPLLPRGAERLGDLALAAGHPAEALEAFRRAARERPRPEGLDLRMGRALRRLGDLGGARQAYRRAISADPGNAEAGDSLRGVERTRR